MKFLLHLGLRILIVSDYLLSTLISFSNESSFPFKAFLSIILTAYIWPSSLLSASLTCEKAPLKKEYINHQYSLFSVQALLLNDGNDQPILPA